MKTQDIPLLLQFALVLKKNTKFTPDSQIAAEAAQLIKLSKRHRSLSIRRCNEGDLPSIMKRIATLEESIRILSKPYGTPLFGGDPRGYTVSILFKSGDYNTMGGEEAGWGIPNY